MIKVVTAAQMRDIDRRTIEEMGIPGVVLMENAGIAVVNAIREKIPDLRKTRVNIFCGKGNNGGDGFVVARHLFNLGAEPTVFLVAEKEEIKGDARINLDSFIAIGGRVKEFTTEKHIHNFKLKFFHTTVVVDALLGTGASSEPKGFYIQALEAMNGQGKLKVAVDIPSGVMADDGSIPGAHFVADVTVTFGLPKPGLLITPARNAVGQLVIADISIPSKVVDESPCSGWLPEKEDIRKMLPRRPPDGHKGTFGHLLTACGSTGMGGAAALCGLSALRAGTGLVTAALPSNLLPSFELGAMEVIGLPLPETETGSISDGGFDRFMAALEGKSAIAMGPGLTTHPSTASFVRRVVESAEIPMVLDADGLNCLAGHMDIIKRRKHPTIITPHPGEMGRLTGQTAAQVQQDRLKAASALAMETGAIVALKGAGTVISTPDGANYINPTGNEGLASGGTGDVLTGLIGGLLAQGAEAWKAAVAGAYIHGLLADIYKAKHVQSITLMASDLLNLMPQAMGEL
ncbi:MAG: NAD(P)H-hydrate dehydratase [Nitrospinae bacterium]|nr:NAD(P)H-hydrate dehydratase [Nitrospinota bacterium]